jgi:hypothetical protein
MDVPDFDPNDVAINPVLNEAIARVAYVIVFMPSDV